MLSEIRDDETANLAVQSALTGTLVFSTLCTQDAPSAITRLMDHQVASYLTSDALIGILAQRLVRKICPNCKISHEPPRSVRRTIQEMGVEISAYYHGYGL